MHILKSALQINRTCLEIWADNYFCHFGLIQGSSSNLNEETEPTTEPITCQDSEATDQHPASITPPQFRESHSNLSSCEAVLTQKLKSLELQNSLSGNTDLGYHKSLALDPSCLLTPPNTPQNLDQAELETGLLEGATQQTARQHRKGNQNLCE